MLNAFQWAASCGSFSRSITPPYGSSSAPDDVITSRTHVLCQLHWLPVRRRVDCKIACLVHQSLHGSAPAIWHMWPMTSTLSPTAATAFSDQQPTRQVSFHVHTTLLATGVSLLAVRGCGTIYRLSCDRGHHLCTIQTTTENISVRDYLTTAHRDCLFAP